MTWVDAVLLAVLAVSAVLAYARGLVQEVLGVGAWIGAALAGFALAPVVSPLLTGIDPPWVADALAVAGVFLVVLVALKVVIAAIARRVQDSVLGSTDRALGLVFGIARGAFLVILAYILAGMVFPDTRQWPQPVRDARLLPPTVAGAHYLTAVLPPRFQPGIVALPRRPELRQDQLERPPARNRQ